MGAATLPRRPNHPVLPYVNIIAISQIQCGVLETPCLAMFHHIGRHSFHETPTGSMLKYSWHGAPRFAASDIIRTRLQAFPNGYFQ